MPDKTEEKTLTILSEDVVVETLGKVRGNLTRASKALGISRRSLSRWLKKRPEMEAQARAEAEENVRSQVEQAVEIISRALARGNLKVALQICRQAKVWDSLALQAEAGAPKAVQKPSKTDWDGVMDKFARDENGALIVGSKQH